MQQTGGSSASFQPLKLRFCLCVQMWNLSSALGGWISFLSSTWFSCPPNGSTCVYYLASVRSCLYPQLVARSSCVFSSSASFLASLSFSWSQKKNTEEPFEPPVFVSWHHPLLSGAGLPVKQQLSPQTHRLLAESLWGWSCWTRNQRLPKVWGLS